MKRSFLAKYHENMVLFGLSLMEGLIRNGEAIMSQAQEILNALGGWDNLTDLQHCITRIRVDFKDDSKIDEAALRKAGAFGVVVVGSHARDTRAHSWETQSPASSCMRSNNT